MFDEQDRQYFYNEFKNNGYQVGSYDDFKKDLNNKEDRDWYYNEAKNMGYDVGTQADFDKMVLESAPSSTASSASSSSPSSKDNGQEKQVPQGGAGQKPSASVVQPRAEKPQAQKPSSANEEGGLISQALGLIPTHVQTSNGTMQPVGGMITNMLFGGNNQQEQQPVQHGNPSAEAEPVRQEQQTQQPTVKDVDGVTGAAPVEQVDAIYNKYVGNGDALSETMYDLMQSGQAQNQEEAQQMAMGAMNRAANRLAQRTTDELVSKLGDSVENIDQTIDSAWYSHATQDKLKNMAAQLGIMNNVAVDENGNYITETDGYDQFINNMVKPAMVESLVKKYGENYRNIAEGLATRLYSHDEHIQGRLMNQDINDALSEVISKYTSTSVAKAIQDAEAASNAKMAKYNEQSKYVDSASPFAIGAIAEANKERDPQKVLSGLQKKFGKLYQNQQFLNDMSNAAFKVMQSYGMNGTLSGDPKQFKPMINAAIKNELDQLEVKGMIPRGSADYILKTGIENTIIGKVSRKMMQTDYQNWLEDIANQQYQPGFLENVASGALTFAGDAWSYWLPGAAGGKITKSMLAKAEGRLASDLIGKGMERKMAERAAKVLIGKSKGEALKAGAAHGAATFGGQAAISKPIDEVYRIGQFDENGMVYNPSVGKILANTLGEVTKQSAVGAIMQGGTIANMVGKGRGLATNILADVGGKVVDSGIMTGQQLLERMSQDPNFKPTGKVAAETFLESGANLLSIGLPGMMGKYARFKDAREFNRKFEFSDQDIQDLKRFGYDGLRDAFEKLGINGYRAEGDGVQMMGQLTDKYMNLMNDKSVPDVLKAKMMAVVEGKRPSSFSPVVDSIIVQPMDNDGKVYLETLNKDGGIVDRKEYSSLAEAQKADKKLDYEKSLNITSEYEQAYHTDALQDRLNAVYDKARDKFAAGERLNDEDKASIYLHQNAGAIKDIIQRQQSGMELTEQEQQLVNSYRHFYDSAFENSPIMKEYVRTFEDSQGVEHGTLRKSLEGDGKSRTAEQQKLVEEYQKQLYNDIVLKREMNDAKEQMNQPRLEGRFELPGGTQEGGASAENAEVRPKEMVAPEQTVAASQEVVSSPEQTSIDGSGDSNGGVSPSDVPPTPPVAPSAPSGRNGGEAKPTVSNAYTMGQNAYKNGDAEGLKAIDRNDDVAKARLKRAFAGDEAKMNVVVKAYEDGKDMEQFVAQRAGYMTPAQQDAVRKYVEAHDAKKGAYDALLHADDGYGDALKEQLWPYQSEDGNIVPAVLDSGQQVFLKKANEYGGGFVVVPDAEGNPTIKQVSSAEIKQVGTPVTLDEFINQQVEQQKNARQQQFFAQFDGSNLKPNDTVEVAMEAGDEPMGMTFAGYSEDGRIVLSDGKDNIALSRDEFNTWRKNALNASIGAELDAEDVQRENEATAKAEAEKQEKYKKAIFGYAAGQPDYADPQTDPKVAAEYLQETSGADRKALFGNIAAEKKGLQTRINQLREHIANNEEWLSLNADLDPKNAETRALANKQMQGQIADLQTRFDNWNKIRSYVMTPEEATAIKEDRTQKIMDAGVDETAIVPIEGREIAVLSDEELKKQYPTMDEASDYITQERKRIYKIQSDEVQREIDGVDKVLNQYTDGEIDLEPEQLKELNTTKAQLMARQQNLTDSAKDLKAQADKLNTLYRKENMEARAKAVENMTPSEQRLVKAEDAIKNGKTNVLNSIYEETGINFNDINAETPEEYVADNLGRFTLNYEGMEKGGAFLNGLKQETGLGRRDFQKQQVLAKEGEGQTVTEFVHSLYDRMPDYLREQGYTDQDIRDALLNLLGSAESYSDIKNYTLKNRVNLAEQKMRGFDEMEELQREENNDMAAPSINGNETLSDYMKRNGTTLGDTTAMGKQLMKAYIQQKYADKLDEIAAAFDHQQKYEFDGAEIAEDVMKIVDSAADADAVLYALDTPIKSISMIGYEQAIAELEKARMDAAKLGLPALDSKGGIVTGYIVNLAKWAQGEGLEIISSSKQNNYDDLYLSCKDEFGVCTLVPDRGDSINKVIYYPESLVGDEGYLNSQRLSDYVDEFNEGRDWKHSADADTELTDGASFYNGDTAKEFKKFVEEKVRHDGAEKVTFSERLKNAIAETEANPTEAQKKAGNYKKGHLKFGGYDFTVETPKGTTRSGKDEQGKPWSVTMHDTYGYILGKIGVDGDHIDMFINDGADLDKFDGNVVVIDQVNPETGEFDEHKVMYGYPDVAAAITAYLKNYSAGWKGLGKATSVPKATFDKWLEASDRKTKPFRDYAMIQHEEAKKAKEKADENLPFGAQMNMDELPFHRDVKEVKPSDMTEAQQVAYKAVSTMLKKAGIPVKVVSNEEMEKVAEEQDNLIVNSIMNDPRLRFNIKTPEQKEAAKAAYDWASKHRPDKWNQYAIVNMDNPNQMPEYFQKKALAEQWRKYYTNQWRVGNYKAFDLNKPFEEQVKNVVGRVPSEFDPYKADAQRNKRDELKQQMQETEDAYNSTNKERADYHKQLMKEYMDEHGLSSENDIPDDVWTGLRDASFEKYQDKLDTLFEKYKDLDKQIKAVAEPGISYLKGKGVVYGYTDGKEIVLNQEHLNPNTPIHEYQHIWRTAAKEMNPELIEHGDKLIMQTQLFADLKEDPNYKHLTDEEICDEAFARLAGEDGAAILEQMAKDAIKENPLDTAKELSVINKLKDWLKKFWYWALDTFTKWKPEDIKKMTLEDIRNLVLRDLAKGVDPRTKVKEADIAKEEAELEKANNVFNQRLDELVKNPNQKDKILRLGRASSFLKDGGVADANIELEFDKLQRKSSEKYKNNHPFAASDLKDLPKAIAKPIAVFNSTNANDHVVLTELKKDDKNFIVAIRAVEKHRKGGVILEVNEITSLYPKNEKGIVNWINTGRISNVDKEKALHFIEALQPHAGTTITDEELKSAANIINSFETTKGNGKKLSLVDDKTLAGVHNITEEKLRKALKLGGFANPSLAVIDTSKNGHNSFGEISFIAPSALVDKRTGKTAGTWTTDAYTQRYPSVERQMTDKGYEKFKKWVDSLDYSSTDKAEIERQTKDVLEDNGVPAWELMFLREKGIDIKGYDSDVDFRWQEIINNHPSAKDILEGMKNDPELKEKVTSLVKSEVIGPTWSKISKEVRKKIYEETGVKTSPINPKVRNQVKEIFERDYAPDLLNKNGSPKQSDVKKVVEQMVQQHEDTKKFSFYKSKVKASSYVHENNLYPDYIRWQEGKLDEFGTKNRIFRGYKNDGTRKYVPETLENVSKAMKEEADGQTNGGEYTSFGSFIAKFANRADSTEEMRANKDKLATNKDKEDFYEKWENTYYELAKDLYNDVFYGEQRLHDVAVQPDPKKYAKKEYGISLSAGFMKKLDALKKAIREDLKSGYFETKFDRPVHLDEFAAAVIPNDLGADVRDGLEKSGLSLYEYDPKKEGDRQRAFGEAVSSKEGIRFMFAGEKGAAEADKAEVANAHKQAQLEIVTRENPMLDDYHTGIRTVGDIKTFAEAMEEAQNDAKKYEYDKWSSYPDEDNELLQDALDSGKITIYSSKPIVNGNFVTPSRMQAQDYAGGGKVYEKTVPITDVAWINVDEGQYAKVTKKSLRERMEANEEGIRMANLKVAEKMERGKKDAKAIKMATGWERGADGKWRYEMPDAKIKDTLDVGGGNIVKRNEEDMLWNGGKLEKTIDAPELFKHYPQLKDVRINTDAIMNDMPSNGVYNPNTKTITIHADELKYLNKILNHEIQHAIQDIEGFAPGGTPENVRKRVEEAMADLEESSNISKESLEEYKRINTHLVQLQCAKQWEKNPKAFLRSSAKYTAPGYYPGTPKEEQIKIGQDLALQWKQEANKFVRSRYYYRDSSDYEEMDNEKMLSKWSKQMSKQYSDDKATSDKFDKLDKALHSLTNYELYHALAGEVEARNVEARMGMSEEERRQSLASETEDVNRDEQIVMNGDGASYSIVEDPKTIKKLDKEETVKVYRAMQVIEGKLYPPMAAKVGKKLVSPIELGKWEQADERPELADDKGFFKLDKANGKSVPARYNPYLHTSYTPLNDQFSEAQNRPNLVTVEVEVPKSELTSGYWADKAKDPVGEIEWPAGLIQKQLTGKRKVVLSRWDKPVRIVPDSEVADVIVNDMFKGKNITMPSNVVTPSLRKELEKRGVPFVETNNKGVLLDGEHAGTHYSRVYAQKRNVKLALGGSGDSAINAENERNVADAVVNTANKLGGAEAAVYTSVDDVPEEYRAEVEQGARGWYDSETHTVHVYLPNCADANEAQRTVLHEKVGHEGMEVLLGGENEVRKFADFVFKSVGKKVRGKILGFANEYDPDWKNADRLNVGTQEYIAHLAEEGPQTAEDFSLWTKIKHYLIKVLKKLGIRVPGLLNDKDLRYYLMKAGKALHVWDNMPKAKQEAMMAQASEADIKDALADGAGKGKPRQKKGESAIQYMKRVMEWKRWKEAREDENDPEPPMFYDSDKDIEGKKEWERLNKEWRDAHGLAGDEMPLRPERKEGETDESFMNRYKEWEKWNDAMADKENPMPDMFAFEKQKQDEARKRYEDWLVRHELLEQEQADLDLYEGKVYPAETNPEADALEQRTMQDLAEVTSTDVSKEGAARTVKHAVIHRRKNMEEASADDAIYINDVKNRIEKMADSGAFDKLLADYQGKPNKAEKLAEAIPFIIEAPRRLRDLAHDLNNTGAFDKGHIHIQPADVEAIQPYVEDLAAATAKKHTELKNGKEVEVYNDPQAVSEVASKMAQAINKNHQGEEGFVPIDGTDILSEHVLPLVMQQVAPRGIDYQNISPEMKSAIDSIRDWYNYTYDWLKDNNTLKEDTGYNADYVNHIWDKEKSDKEAYAMYVENRQRTKSPNEKPRTISTLMEGINVGLVPKTTDITKMMAYYSRSNIEAWATKTMLQEVSGLNVVERNEDGEIISSDPLLSSVAPFNLEQYKYFEIPGVGPVWVYNVSPKQVKVKNPITGKDKVLFSEASAGDRFGVVFDTYQSTPFWKFFDTTASSMKKLELGFSGFHAGALTEVYMVQNMVEHGPKKALANFMKYIFADTMKNHQLPCFANPEDFQEAASHLVKFGATNDYAAADVQNMFDNFRDSMMKVQEKLGSGNVVSKAGATVSLPLKVASQMLSLINKGMDRALWDFLHDGLKLATYRMRADKTKSVAKSAEWTDEELSKALDEDGQFVNDMFGGQHWDVLGASTRTLRYAGRVLLSPDWNASTTRHFLALTGYGSVWNEATMENFKQYYKNVWGAVRHDEGFDPGDYGRVSRQISALICYGIGFMVFYEALANGINAGFRALDEEKEREKAEDIRKTNPDYRSPYELAYPDGIQWYDYLMRGNSAGQQSKIFVGRYADGTEMYVRHGKQFREVPEYLFNSKGDLEFPGPMVQRMLGKANPMVRMTLDDINYLSDFQASHADQEIQRKYGKTIGLLYKDALYWAPFLIPSQENKEFKAVDFFFPSSKGFSNWKAQDYFKNFILSGDMEGVMLTYRSCQKNGVDAEKQLQAAISSIKALEAKEMQDGVTSLQVASERFDGAKSVTEKRKMREKMRKFLAQSEYKAFTAQEAMDMVKAFQEGVDPKEMVKTDSKYLMVANSEDVTEDWRIQQVRASTKGYADKLAELKESDKAKYLAFKNAHANVFKARKAISQATAKMNKLKKKLGEGNDEAILKQIRGVRKDLLKQMNGMEHLKEYKE